MLNRTPQATIDPSIPDKSTESHTEAAVDIIKSLYHDVIVIIGSFLCKKESVDLGKVNRQWYHDTRQQDYMNWHQKYRLNLGRHNFHVIREMKSIPLDYTTPNELKLGKVPATETFTVPNWFGSIFSNVSRLYLDNFLYLDLIPIHELLNRTIKDPYSINSSIETAQEQEELDFYKEALEIVHIRYDADMPAGDYQIEEICLNIESYLEIDGIHRLVKELHVQCQNPLRVVETFTQLGVQTLHISSDIEIKGIRNWNVLFGSLSLQKVVIDDMHHLWQSSQCYYDTNDFQYAVSQSLKEIEITFTKDIHDCFSRDAPFHWASLWNKVHFLMEGGVFKSIETITLNFGNNRKALNRVCAGNFDDQGYEVLDDLVDESGTYLGVFDPYIEKLLLETFSFGAVCNPPCLRLIQNDTSSMLTISTLKFLLTYKDILSLTRVEFIFNKTKIHETRFPFIWATQNKLLDIKEKEVTCCWDSISHLHDDLLNWLEIPGYDKSKSEGNVGFTDTLVLIINKKNCH